MTRPPYGDGAQMGTRGMVKAVILGEAQGWRCAYCPTIMTWGPGSDPESDAAITVDHVIAISAGGHRTWHNEIAACRSCNMHKGQYSAMLFWLLMQRHHHDRKVVIRMLVSSTKRQREKMRKRLNQAMGISDTITTTQQQVSA